MTKNDVYKHSYDLVVCMQVLEHVSYPKKILKEISNVMNKNSILYIEIPHEKMIRDNELPVHKKHWHEHINFYTKDSLKFLIECSGLIVIELLENIVQSEMGNLYLLQAICKKRSSDDK